jgi:hypothetical protein
VIKNLEIGSQLVGINQRQFTQLNEMGISVWHSRERGNNDAIPKTRVEHNTASPGDNLPLKSALSNEQTSALHSEKNTLATTSLELLNQSPLFLNIIAVMNVSIGEVIEENDHYNLGLFNWHFYSTDNNADNNANNNADTNLDKNSGVNSDIVYQNNNLITPTIECISTSASLKKQLWLTISNHIL